MGSFNHFVNYRHPDLPTLPSLSMPSMERTYLNASKDLIYSPEINVSDAIEELDMMRKNDSIRDLYSMQQLFYNNASYLYRLLYHTLTLFSETFNPNSYYEIIDGDDNSTKYSKADNIINEMLNLSNEFDDHDSELLYHHVNYIDQSLLKIHSILLDIHFVRTSSVCNGLRNYFSTKPTQNKKLKMSEYITNKKLSNRTDLLFQILTENSVAYKHIFLTRSIEIEKMPTDNKGNPKKNHIRINFKESDSDSFGYFDLKISEGIGKIYYGFLSAIIHDAIPIYTKPDNISNQYLPCNILCTVITMEILLIIWEDLATYLKFYCNEDMKRYTFSKWIYDLVKNVSNDSSIHNRIFALHTRLMCIIESVETEKLRYIQNFDRYINYIQSEQQYRTIIEKKFLR